MRIETLDEKIKKYKKIFEAEKTQNESASSDGEAELFGEKVEKYQRNNRDDDPR